MPTYRYINRPINLVFQKGEHVKPKPSDYIQIVDKCDGCNTHISASPTSWGSGLECPQCDTLNKCRIIDIAGNIHGKIDR